MDHDIGHPSQRRAKPEDGNPVRYTSILTRSYKRLILEEVVSDDLLDGDLQPTTRDVFAHLLYDFGLTATDFWRSRKRILAAYEAAKGEPLKPYKAGLVPAEQAFLRRTIQPYLDARYFGCPTLFLDDADRRAPRPANIKRNDLSLGLKILANHRILETGGTHDESRALALASKDPSLGDSDRDRAYKGALFHNIRALLKRATGYAKRSSITVEEFVNIGIEVFPHIIEKYDGSTTLLTYGMPWIRTTMTRAIHDLDRTIRVPVHIQEEAGKIRRATAKILSEKGQATPQAIAEETGLSVDKVAWARHSMAAEASLDEKLPDEDRDRLEILSHQAPRPDQIVERGHLKELMREMLDSLSPREREVLERKYGIRGEQESLAAIGRSWGRTRERARQIEHRALKRLRHPSRARKLMDFY